MHDQRVTLEASLFQQYYGELLRFLTAKLGCREQAADVVQDTFLRVRGLKDLAEVAQPRAFLYKTAVNLSIDLFRRQRIRAERITQLETAEELPSLATRPDDAVEAKERVQLLHAAIAELPPKCRQVFLLHKFLELSHADIAGRLGISKNMVEKHVMKAMAHCRRRVELDGGVSRADRS
ncbi:sigma-70 family RNA polymerase sigma factor [Nitrospira lenta]|uniref:ECF-type RNA polymerase sigma factor, sigma-70 family n=1 Tax=Nitrospira lenta TaxID=1436998 RepID=A0A330L7D5_9BACT|nr:sigma-70 family RNA polymerase sigma factor [Nitrospira lenta]SPP65592.1 ECF-type RNA polymerase sigma factor, sigma-70 family [Nitrospira lenta]